MLMRHDMILSESWKITHRNNSNDKYGLVCFKLVSSIDIQVAKYV